MDNLKEYIQENRAAFDLNEPTNALWNKIEAGLDSDNVKDPIQGRIIPFVTKRWFSLSVAASIVVLLSIGFLAGKYWSPVSEHNDIISLSPKYGTEVVKYASFVDQKKQLLNDYAESNPALHQTFTNDLTSLSANFEELRKILPNNPNQEVILNKMIDNLLWQMELLDQQINVIQEKNESSNEEIVKTPKENKNEAAIMLV